MPISGNQYANKVFAEHPISLWPLDEDVFFLSLIDDNDRLFSNWTKTNCTANDNPDLSNVPESPISDTIYSSIVGTTPAPNLIEVESPSLFDITQKIPSDQTFCVNFFLYQKPDFINWIKVGYRYVDDFSNIKEVISEQIPAPQFASWMNFNNTYMIPQDLVSDVKIFIQINMKDSSGGDASSRTFIMNGLSVAQGSEATCYENLGSNDIEIPEELNLTGITGIAADQYGILSNAGYYLVKNNQLLAKNDGAPIIYGTKQSTKIYPSGTDVPSFVFPGKGMLHEKGRNKKYTFEMWMKIDPTTTNAQRIVGPLDSNDGLYVKEGFLTLVVGDQIGSHCVSEWYRPMLVHVVMKENNITVILNGEEVIDISFNRSSIDLPDARDWWGVYSYSDFSLFNVDCISIFPYVLPTIVAKKRFVYGEGSPAIQSVDNQFQGTSVVADFPTAEYSSNIIYPDIARWDAGYFNNLNATKDYLSVPNYQLPTINIGGRDLGEWYEANRIINFAEYPERNHPNFITFRPNQGTRENLINNPSFELNAADWLGGGSASATIGRTTAKKYIGTASLSASASGAGDIVVYQGNGTASSYINILPNTEYCFSAYSLAQSTTRQVDANIEWFDDLNASISASSGTAVTNSSTAWTRSSIVATSPSNAVKARVYVKISSASINEIHYLDAMLFEQSASVNAYFDGGYIDPTIKAIDYGWTGTANLSPSTVSFWNPDGLNYNDQYFLNFPTLNILNDAMAAVYGIFEIEKDIDQKRTLMSFSKDQSSLDIYVYGDTINYALNDNVFYSSSVTIGMENLVGINFELAGIEFGYDVAQFFSSPSSVQLYVGGNGEDTFEGKIYQVGFCNQNNYAGVSDYFLANGIANKDDYIFILDRFASYTLIPEYEYGKMFLDISVASEWEEYFPLTYFASFVKDANGEQIYDLDFLQINLGYVPSVSSVEWYYNELNDEFIGQDYQDLKDSVYVNYLNLKKRNSFEVPINVSGSSLQGFLTFQPLDAEENTPIDDFEYIQYLAEDFVIDADSVNTPSIPDKAYRTKFPFTDNVIVYPPKSQDFRNYAMVVTLQINQRSILKNPLKIKSFEITSKNLNYTSTNNFEEQRNYIGTKYGTKIYPQIDIFGEIDYKDKNPYFIYKAGTPYVYSTAKSGFQIVNPKLLNNAPTLNEYKIQIPVNKNASFDFRVGAIKFDLLAKFPDVIDQIPIVEVKHANGIISFILEKTEFETIVKAYSKNPSIVVDGGDSSTSVFADTWDAASSSASATLTINVTAASVNTETGEQYEEIGGVSFYQNGRYVKSPVIRNNEWNTIAILFDTELDFSEYSEGNIEFLGGFVFNNVSYYLSEGLGTKTNITTRTWNTIVNYADDPLSPPPQVWAYWLSSSQTWQYVYVVGKYNEYLFTPSSIYETYTGTNINVIDDDYGLQLAHKETNILSGVSWSLYSGKPA